MTFEQFMDEKFTYTGLDRDIVLLKDVFDYCKTNNRLDNLGFKKSSDLASKMETQKGLERYMHPDSRAMCFKGIKFAEKGADPAPAPAVAVAHARAAAAHRAPMFLVPAPTIPEENMLDDVYDI